MLKSRPIVAFVATTAPSLGQDDRGIWSAPSGAKVAWFHDPDGNTLSLTELERRKNKKRIARTKKGTR